RNARDMAGAVDRLALADVLPLAEQRRADVVLLQVERQPDDAVLELEHLQGHGVLEAVNAGDAVADLEDGADFGQVRLDVEVFDPLLEDRGDFFWPELHEQLLCVVGTRVAVAGGAGLCPSAAQEAVAGPEALRRGLTGEPWVPPCVSSGLSFKSSPSIK